MIRTTLAILALAATLAACGPLATEDAAVVITPIQPACVILCQSTDNTVDVATNRP